MEANTMAHRRLRGVCSPAGHNYFLAAFCLLMRAYGRQPLMLSMSPMWACKSSAMQLKPGLFGVLCMEDEVHLHGGRNTKQTGQETRHNPVPRAGHCAGRSAQQYGQSGHDPADSCDAARLTRHRRQDTGHTISPHRRALRSTLHSRVSRRQEAGASTSLDGTWSVLRSGQRNKLLCKHSMSLAWPDVPSSCSPRAPCPAC